MDKIREIEEKLNKLDCRKSMMEWYIGKFTGMLIALESQHVITHELADALRGAMGDIRSFGTGFANELKEIYDENLTYRKGQEEDKKYKEDKKCKK